ncbi:ankyrin repeat domain-containing protein [Stenotrophomonas acidaminiphila]
MTLHSELIHAVRCNSERRISELFNKGADVRIRTGNGLTLMHVAVEKNAFKSVETLLKLGLDINAKSDHGKPAIVHFVNTEMMTFLIDRGADVNAWHCNGLNLLMNKIAFGDYSQAVMLLEAGALATTVDSDGSNCFHHMLFRSIFRDSIEHLEQVVDLLLEAGCNPKHRNNDGRTPLQLAHNRGDSDNVKVIERAEAIWEKRVLELKLTEQINKELPSRKRRM